MKLLNMKIKKRGFVSLIIFAVLFSALCVRVGIIQFVDGKELSAKAVEQQTKDSTITSKRGIIYDRNGIILAQSASVETVTVTPKEIAQKKNAKEVAEFLAEVLEMDKDEVYAKITKNSGYEIVKRKIENEQAEQIREKEFAGVHLIEDTKRYYPYGTLASHVIGFVGTDNQGLNGVEMVYDKYLKGLPGRIVGAKNAKGTEMPFKYEKYIGAEDGQNITLTIDSVIQQIAENVLNQAVADYKVEMGAACILMSAKTGDILAMASVPEFDLNAPFTLVDENVQKAVDALSGEVKQELYEQSLLDMWRNKAVVDSYEPGSTFKAITTAMALEEGVVSLNDHFTCTGSLRVGNETIKCWKHGGHGPLDFVGGVEQSCNPVFMTVGARIGTDNFRKYIKAFGFAQTTGFDLPGEATGIFYGKDNFNEVELATSSFGQGPTVTPLQMVAAYSAICNDGMMVKPKLIKEITDIDGNIIKSFDTEYVRQVISKETAQTTREILESVVTVGSSKNAYIKGYRVAGKTGTSETTPRGNGRYIASFVGFAPANDPEIVGILLLDKPMGPSHMGGVIAAPTFKKIFEDVLRYMKIETQYTAGQNEEEQVWVPIVETLGKDEAIKAFQGTGLKYQIVGSGDTIKTQIPKGNTMIDTGSTVVLYTDKVDADDELITVPSVKGMTASQANKALTNAGLNMKIAGNTSGSQTDGYILSQSPAEKDQVKRGSVVTVEINYTTDVH